MRTKSKARLLLIRPPSHLGVLTYTSSSHQPINLGYLASFITERGYEVRIKDLEVEPFDPAWVSDYSPLLIGITSLTPTFARVMELARILKEYCPASVIAIGGPHPSALPIACLHECESIDYCIQGEGEVTLFELLDALAEDGDPGSIPGVYTRDSAVNGITRRKRIEDLDSLKSPARELFPLKHYHQPSSPGIPRKRLKTTEVCTSRGCPYGCSFCQVRDILGEEIRFRSPENVQEEVTECLDRFGIEHINFTDEVFTFNPERTTEIARFMGSLGLSWNCESRVDRVSLKLLESMRKGGCLKINFGVESGSARVLKFLKKGINLTQVRRAFAWAKEAGLERMAFFMIGATPDETEEDIKATLELSKEIDPEYASFAIATPFPGTPLWDIFEREGLILSRDWSRFSPYNALPAWRTMYFGPEDLFRIHKRLHRQFYLSLRYWLKRALSIRTLQDIGYWIKAGLSTLRYVMRSD